MQADAIRSRIRQKIAEKSIQILRRHGKSDKEIRSVILHDFQIEENVLDGILNTDIK